MDSLSHDPLGGADGCHGPVHLERWRFDLEATSAAAARLCSCIRCSKSCPRSSFGRILPPPRRPRAAQMAGWWNFLRPPNICDWRLRYAQNMSGLPPIMDVGGGVKHKIVQNSSPGAFFHIGHIFQTSPIQDGVGTAEKHVKNATPSPEMRPEIRPLRQK